MNTEPNRANPCTEPELPARPTDRSDSELPNCRRSSTAIETSDPRRATPYIDIELPLRPYERSDSELFDCTKFSADLENTDPI
jgi:hypothetical protein